MQQVEQLPSGAPNGEIDARPGTPSPKLSPEQPQPATRKNDLQLSSNLTDAETTLPPAARHGQPQPATGGHNRTVADSHHHQQLAHRRSLDTNPGSGCQINPPG
jgi:hypothetical protein